MPARRTRRPVARRIPLSDLLPRADRATVLPARARKALADQIARHGCYPALIVRAHPRRAGKYEILDGHHRAEILRGLGEDAARCEVWPVMGDDVDVVAATLNRLRGRQGVRQRGRQVRGLVRKLGRQGAATALGLTPRGLRQQLDVARSPVRREAAEGLDLEPVVFHLSRRQAADLREALRRAGGDRLPRGQALVRALERPSARESADAPGETKPNAHYSEFDGPPR
jgi:hypothetical protein